MRELIIDGKAMTSEKSMYIHLSRVFSFPTYFGNNLDALWDALTEESEPTVIYFKNVTQMTENLDRYGEKLIQLFQKLEQTTNNYKVHFYPEEMIEEE